MSSLRSLAILMSLCVAKLISSIDAASVVVNETVGGRAILKCHTSQRTAVDWWYQRTEGDNTRQICLNGEVVVEMRSRFSICSQTTGDYNLVIEDVDLTDSGVYTCVEDAGLGQRTTIQLMITADGVNRTDSAAVQAHIVSESSEYHEYHDRADVSVAAIVVPLVVIPAAVIVVIILSIVYRERLLKIAGSNCPAVARILSKCPGSGKSHEYATTGTSMTPAGPPQNRSMQVSPGLNGTALPESETLLPCGTPSNGLVAQVQPNVKPISTVEFHDELTDKQAKSGDKATPRVAKADVSTKASNKENRPEHASVQCVSLLRNRKSPRSADVQPDHKTLVPRNLNDRF